MKTSVIALALAATAFGALTAQAQTTTIIQEERPPAVVVEPQTSTTVTTHERSGLLGTESKTTTETTGSGPLGDCSSKTVHKEGPLTGEKTVSKTNCP